MRTWGAMTPLRQAPVPGPPEVAGPTGSAALSTGAGPSEVDLRPGPAVGTGPTVGTGPAVGTRPAVETGPASDGSSGDEAAGGRARPLGDLGRRLVSAGVPRILVTATVVFAVRLLLTLVTAAFAVHT